MIYFFVFHLELEETLLETSFQSTYVCSREGIFYLNTLGENVDTEFIEQIMKSSK